MKRNIEIKGAFCIWCNTNMKQVQGNELRCSCKEDNKYLYSDTRDTMTFKNVSNYKKSIHFIELR